MNAMKMMVAVAAVGALVGCGGGAGDSGALGSMGQNAKGGTPGGPNTGGGSNGCSGGGTQTDAAAPSVSVYRDADNFDISVIAGSTGAHGGFVLQWAPADDVYANGWPAEPCSADFNGIGQGSDHQANNLDAGAERPIDLAALNAGATYECQISMDCGTEYVFRATAKTWRDQTACTTYHESTYSADEYAQCPAEEGCNYSQGYWKNHPDAWPVAGVTLGGTYYAKSDAITILKTPPAHGNGALILAHQLIAAKLNVASGMTAPTELGTCDALLNGITLPGGSLASSATSYCAGYLDGWNTGELHCENDPDYPETATTLQ